jgi:hypothetical protein
MIGSNVWWSKFGHIVDWTNIWLISLGCLGHDSFLVTPNLGCLGHNWYVVANPCPHGDQNHSWAKLGPSCFLNRVQCLMIKIWSPSKLNQKLITKCCNLLRGWPYFCPLAIEIWFLDLGPYPDGNLFWLLNFGPYLNCDLFRSLDLRPCLDGNLFGLLDLGTI